MALRLIGTTASATVSITRPGTNPTNAVGEAIEFEATGVSGLDLSGYTYTLADAPLDQLVEWYWTITPPSGAATTWTAPTRLAPGHNSRLTAYGRRGFIIPDVPGTWTFAVWGVDKNGATVEASASCEVVATSAVVSDANSWVLYTDTLPGGGVEGTDYATGRAYTSIDTLQGALFAAGAGGNPIRIRVQGGGSWTQTTQLYPRNSGASAVIFETYGTGRATVNVNDATFYFDGHSGYDYNVQFRGINVVPTWDMSSESPFAATGGSVFVASTTETSRAISISDCEMVGIQSDNQGVPIYVENTKFKDYPEFCFLGQGPAFFRGINFDMPATHLIGGRRNEAITDSTRRNAHAILRENGPRVIDGCTFFSQNGWTYTAFAEWPFSQQLIRYHPSADGSADGRLNIQRCVFEGSVYVRASAPQQSPTNVLIERSIFLSHHQFGEDGMVEIKCSGVTVRNCQLTGTTAGASSSAYASAIYPHIALTSFLTTGTLSLANTDPVRIINNTGIDLRTGAKTYEVVKVIDAFSQQELVNNIEYAPNYTVAHEPDGALVAEAGTTPVNAGSYNGFTHHQFTLGSDLAVGATSAVFSWFNDVDDNPVDHDTFNTGAEKDNIFNGSTLGYMFNFATTSDGISINKTPSGWSITNNLSTSDTRGSWIASGVLKAGTYYLQLDRRHDPVVKSGTASGVNDGQLYAPASAVAPDNSALVPYFDFKGNVRSSGSPTKGAIDPNGVAA